MVDLKKIFKKPLEVSLKNNPIIENPKKNNFISSEFNKPSKANPKWVEKQKLLQLSEISLVLDEYDDIFSDFDPRTFDKRALSDDFLVELKRASRGNKKGLFELNLLIPLEQRKEETENKIKKRLREHFKRHHEEIRKEVDKIKLTGILMVLFGLLLSILSVIFVVPFEEQNIFLQVLMVLIEPAAWFTIWEGANKIIETWKILAPDLEFYKKMTKCEINFTPY
ncbi:MAG: hypothetical protein PHY04_01560 [Candidatus ainarchaeum sp.]|jgi:hypothetical protein|nr:hypothetical protein [Candidatus ainarchaeum sp.]MDD3085907.1 hypothetical protein [Candidatus ainarchaeum sp.]MDD4128403.1 hypothetical protein [Candidatus ainarchaeum sp.]MDD4468131.1 hypothetical protein [Candidatus ainarchaeum sp.]HPM85615.1 hypothetical protein [archaeon]